MENKRDSTNPEDFLSVRFFRWLDKIKKDKLRFFALILLLVLFCVYFASLFSLFFTGHYKTVSFGNVEYESLSPLNTIPLMIADGNAMMPVYFLAAVFALLMLAKMGLPTQRYDERGFTVSKFGTYGTSSWMGAEEMNEKLLITNVKDATGPVFGAVDENKNILTFRTKPEYEGDLRPYLFNRNCAVYGAPGSGKSRCYVRTHIFQCVRRGESIVVTDPKSELFSSMAGFLQDNGYAVRVFNLVTPEFGDSWNPLYDILQDKSQLQLMAQTFANVVIENTLPPGGKADQFWDGGEKNLLTALTLYVLLDSTLTDEEKNFGEVYKKLTESDFQSLEEKFNALPADHLAKQPWTLFKQLSSTGNVAGNMVFGLGNRLQVFQNRSVRNLTAQADIDLTEPGKKKTAIFLIMSDQDSTLNFLSSLFFSFIFIRLVRYADMYCKGQKLTVPVNFILDEFPNIGRIPDFEKKISTVRSRLINISLIFQNLAQLQNRYPNGTWEEILGNCDAQLFLGCTDQLTAEYISKRTGELTVEVSSTQVQKKTIAITDSHPTYRSTDSVGKRPLLTPDEVLRLDNQNCLLILRGCKVIKLLKFDYSKHPDAKRLRDIPIVDYVPYRDTQTSAKVNPADVFSATAKEKQPKDYNKKSAEWVLADSVEEEEEKNAMQEEETPKKKEVKTTKFYTPDSSNIG